MLRSIYSTEIDNSKGIDIVMSMYDLKEYSNKYSETPECLW